MARKQAEVEAAPVDFSEGDSLMVDLNNVEDVSFEAMPRAIYPCVVSNNEFTYSQNSGNPMWTLTLEVEDGEYAGRNLWSHLVFAGKGLPMTKRQLSRIAPELMDGPFDPQDEQVIGSLLGRRIRAKVAIRMFEGEKRNNVRDLYPAEEAGSFV